jgi:acetyl-CoA synthetase
MCNRRYFLVSGISHPGRVKPQNDCPIGKLRLVQLSFTSFPGVVETDPGSATVPFFGVKPAILDPVTGKKSWRVHNIGGVLALKNPWPSIACTIYRDLYMQPYPGMFYTGDNAARDEHGYIWIKGRVRRCLFLVYHRPK